MNSKSIDRWRWDLNLLNAVSLYSTCTQPSPIPPPSHPPTILILLSFNPSWSTRQESRLREKPIKNSISKAKNWKQHYSAVFNFFSSFFSMNFRLKSKRWKSQVLKLFRVKSIKKLPRYFTAPLAKFELDYHWLSK